MKLANLATAHFLLWDPVPNRPWTGVGRCSLGVGGHCSKRCKLNLSVLLNVTANLEAGWAPRAGQALVRWEHGTQGREERE